MTEPLDPPPRAESAPSDEPEEDRASEVHGAPWHRGVLTAVRKRRTLVLAAAAVVAVAVATTLVVTLSGDESRPVPSGAMPTLGNQFATQPTDSATPDPDRPASLPEYSGRPLWTIQWPAGADVPASSEFAISDHGYVIKDREEVRGLDRAGKEIWRFTPPNVDYFTVRVTGPQVFVAYANPDDDRWPQPVVVIALDAATGGELWRETEASLWAVTTDTIYMSVCYGGQNNHIGDCSLSARDPRANTIRWSVPTYASSRVENDSQTIQAAPTPPYLLVGSYPTGSDSYVLTSHNPATGALRGSGFDGPDGKVGSINAATERLVVTAKDNDENPADGCAAIVTGFSVTGAGKIWQHTARTAKTDDGKRCGRQPESRNDGRLGVTEVNGAPSVLNLDTGAIEWSAPPTGEAVAASGTTLLVAETTEAGATELVAYRVGNAKPVWRTPFPGDFEGSTVTITDTQIVVIGYGGEASGFDPKTGKGWTYPGSVVQETPSWFVVCAETSCSGYPIG